MTRHDSIAAPRPTTGPWIVAVDDSDIALDIIRLTMGEIGFANLDTFLDPREALAAMRAAPRPPDLFLLDFMMPDMDGIELCAHLRMIEGTMDTPIIMLTSCDDLEILSRAFMAGANDYVTKPFQKVELEARIKSCLRLKSELDRRRASEAQLAAQLKLVGRDGTDPVSAGGTLLVPPGLFDQVLRLLPQADGGRLGLIAMRVVSGSAQSPGAVRSPPKGTDAVLAQVEVPACAVMTRLERGLYCCATLGLSGANDEALARRFVAAIDRAKLVDEGQHHRPALRLRTGCARAGHGLSVAAALADAIRSV